MLRVEAAEVGPPHLAEQGEGPGVRGLLGGDGHREAGAGVHVHSVQEVAKLDGHNKQASLVSKKTWNYSREQFLFFFFFI